MRGRYHIIHTISLVVFFASTPFVLLVPILQHEKFSSAIHASVLPSSPKTPKREPPKVIRGIYLTANTAGSQTRREALFDLVDRTELNAVVIDVKDSDG